MLTATRLAPAKINLALRVLGRRPDGYHEIDSIFLPLELADTVEVTVHRSGELAVTCQCPGHPDLDGEGNLAFRAAQSYLERAGLGARILVTIHKRIWTAAGLGGGSSDAAAVLLALRDTLGGLAPEAILNLARGLGADVPYFLDPRPMRAQGIGHELTFLSGCPPLPLVLLNPGRPLSTAAVYSGLGLPPGKAHSSPLENDHLGHLADRWRDLLENDLEEVAARQCPEIPVMKEALRAAGAVGVSMSGSGPTVFGVFEGAEAARRAADNLRGMTGFSATATATASP
jgi:4-diphosphocytidyl-2-C-methyl-D-erythritol kinase